MQLLSYCLLAFHCSLYASATSVFNGLEEGDNSPRFLNTKDSRTDGISHEVNRALVAEHLKATSHVYTFGGAQPAKTLEDLMKPGALHISLAYWTTESCRRTDNFLCVLNKTELSKESRWIIDVRGMWGYHGNVNLLAEVIKTLPAIAEVHWNTQRLIPAIILRSLQEKHPECRLYYTIPFKAFGDSHSRDGMPFNTDESRTEQNILRIAKMQQSLEETSFRSILESKILYSLTARIDHAMLFPAEKLDFVHQILLTCPNIRELDLRIDIADCKPRTDESQCCEDPSKDAVLAFDFTKYDGTLAPLEVLKLYGYRFDFAVDGTHADPNLQYDIANLNAWQKHMDWSRLRSLHVSNPLALEMRLFINTLPNLLHFRIDGGHVHHVRGPVLSYLAKIPPLESLALEESTDQLRPSLDALLDLIETHHSTLRSFKLNHERDGPRISTGRDAFWPNHFIYAAKTLLNSAQLTRLFSICPDLHSLDIDIRSTDSGSWDYDILDTILSFPQLTTLTLRFPPEISDQLYAGYQGLQIRVDKPEWKTAMKGLRNYLRRGKVGEPFEGLRTFLGWKEFRDGEEAEKGPGYMIY